MDVPENLEPDGRNYVEWTWSLLDDGIDVCDQASFSTLRTPDGQPLLEADVAEHLDGQMLIAKKAAVQKGHDFADVILCCKAPNVDSGAIADELAKQFFSTRLLPWPVPGPSVKSVTSQKISTSARCTSR